MLRILKRFYPFREIARIIDLHFQRLYDLSGSLAELQNSLNSENREVADNHTAILQALTFTVERLQQQQAALERLEGGQAKCAEALASVFERQQQQHAVLERIEAGQAESGEALASLVERQQQQHAVLERIEAGQAESSEALASLVEREQQQHAVLGRIEAAQAESGEALASLVEREQQQHVASERLGPEIAENHAAILQALTFTVERQQQQQVELERLEAGQAKAAEALTSMVERQEQRQAALERIEDSRLRGADSRQRMEHALASLDAKLTTLKEEGLTFRNRESLERALDRQTELVARVQSQLAETNAIFENELVRQVYVESDDYEAANPETALLTFLYSHLPTRKAMDVGANLGDVSEPLLQAGYEVYAFEPLPQVYERLVQRLGNRSGFHPFRLAIGNQDAEMPLHLATDLSENKQYEDPSVYSSLALHSMPDDLPFTSSVAVTVRTLAGLHSSGILPQDISLVKIDTEGFDLEVVRGMGELRYPVVMAEFWSADIPFGGPTLLYTLESLVGEMRHRQYLWHIVLYRVWGRNQIAYYCNHDKPVTNSWGNVVFFRDHAIFAQAQAWCAAVLPRTYFKPVARPERTL